MTYSSWLRPRKSALTGSTLAKPAQRSAKRSRPRRLALEALEERFLLSTFTVVNTLDSGAGSLRQAIMDANATANVGGPDTIAFNIPGTGVQTISPTSALPTITDPVTIDAYSQLGASVNAATASDNAVLLIQLDGTNAGPNANGLNITAGNSTVKGLVINHFGFGILLTGAGNNTIAGNFIGTDATGMAAAGNVEGVGIGCTNNTVGGTAPVARNIISGNGQSGILIDGEVTAAAGNQILGNFIGTDKTGSVALSISGRSGVLIFDASNNTVGGLTDGARNIISGDAAGYGIEITGHPGLSPGNIVEGNYIGTDVTGTAALPNLSGVNDFGTTSFVTGDLISGNTNIGITAANVATVRGNLIGTDWTGTHALGNGLIGAVIRDGATLGGLTDASRNVISGNGANNVEVEGEGVVIQGNYIGTDITGMVALSYSTLHGVFVFQATDTLIGGAVAGARNVIAGNGIDIRLVIATGTTIQGNYIGVDKTGNHGLSNPNSSAGIYVNVGITNATIGGAAAAARNVIGSEQLGIYITGTDTSGIVVQGNSIGVGADGVTAIPNAGGIGLAGGTFNNTIGGTAQGAGNKIANNIADGVFVSGGAVGASIRGNAIHDNGGLGIRLESATNSNNNQPAPTLTSAILSVGGTSISGTLHSAANTSFAVDFYANTASDPSGFGEGQIYLGSASVTTNAIGDASFSATVPMAAGPGQYISATATDPAGNTSEFSNDVQTPLQVATVTTLSASVNPAQPGQGVIFTASVSPQVGSGTPTGTVQFVIDGSNFGSAVSMTNAIASITTTSLTVGPHTIKAIYSGDSNFLTSTGSLTENVQYNFSGFLPPLNQNIAFGLNRTIPIKWQLSNFSGIPVTSLSAITSLQVAPVLAGGGLGTPFNPTPTGGTVLRNDGGQYIFNWQTKGLAAGNYEILLTLSDGTVKTKAIQLSANGAGGALLVDGTTATTAVGALLAGDIELYVDNSSSVLTAAELARIQDAVASVDAIVSPYGVTITEVTDSSMANVTLDTGSSSAVGNYGNGVLGCTTDSGEITIIQGWNWYAGSNPTAIGAGQYDFQTVVTHELGHALGLGHSANAASVMYATLTTGMTDRVMTVADLNVPDSDSGACGLHAASVGRISNPSYGVDFFEPATGSDPLPTTTGYQELLGSPTARQTALSAVLADWNSTTDFAGQVARIFDEGPAKKPLNRVGLQTNNDQEDFWFSISETPTLDKIFGLTGDLGQH